MTRPNFDTAWALSRKIYVRGEPDPEIRVAKVIGGRVADNINNPNPKQRWENTCAVRMSYILNYSGVIIPAITGKTVSGADKKQYFYRVRDLITFLKEIWGKPEVVDYPPEDGGKISEKKGVILFEVSGWSDAAGHATLFNGKLLDDNKCYDRCYFNSPEVEYQTDRANFWSLP